MSAERDKVVVLTGTEAQAASLGATARELEAQGHRTVVFVGDVTADAGRAALQELLAELFPDP
ncbi:MAG: hypothetical protein U0W40_18225 [Acidimicrobiia bacterium]